MKKNILFIGLVAMTIWSCKNEPTVETSEAVEIAESNDTDIVYSTITEESKINWRGFKVYEGEESGHFGSIKVKKATLNVNAGKLISGNIIADVTTLESEDLNEDPENKAKLDGHLKASDFLDSEKFPTASFEITEIKELTDNTDFNSTLSGNLSIKDKKLNISVLANIETTEEMVSIKTEEFSVDREDFGIKVEGLKGAVLKEKFNLQVDVTAKK